MVSLRIGVTLSAVLLAIGGLSQTAAADDRPNILFCIADDWGWPFAGAYGDDVVQTPAFDRLAREGVLFENAFISSPSCTPSRSAILTGQHFYRLGQAANLWSSIHPKYPLYPWLLEGEGYKIGHWRKAWGPGNWKYLGRKKPPAGPHYRNFKAFLADVPDDKPFCFWLGSSDPHRPYIKGSGAASGIDPAKINVPADLPNHKVVRNDIADYFVEVQQFDSDVGWALKLLEKAGKLENTIVVMTGDHGMPFPRHKTQLYDSGTHVPLAIRWGKRVPGGRRVSDLVSLTDLAPTFLEACGVEIPKQMTGQSLLPILTSEESGRVDKSRDYVIVGRERHTQCQEKPNPGGYPTRAIRTDDFLYIYNFDPNRWPAGAPDPEKSFNGRVFGDCDGGPTKTFVMKQKGDPKFGKFYNLAFAKRPAEELYDLSEDPGQLHSVASDPQYSEVKAKLKDKLFSVLKETKDPRALGTAQFDTYPYRPGRK